MSKKLRPIFLVAFVILLILSNVSFLKIIHTPSQMYVDYQEIDEANKSSSFGKFVDIKLTQNELNASKSEVGSGEIVFKLFGLIPIKKVDVKILPEDEVYLGGMPIGLTVKTKGVMVVGDTIVDSLTTTVRKNKYLKTGDLIQAVNGRQVENIEELTTCLNDFNMENLSLTILRNNKQQEIQMPLIKNDIEKYSLGVWVKDDCSGIGTLTFVKKNDNSYGALGHAVTNGQDEKTLPIKQGDIYSCSLVNIEKGEKNRPGQLQCVFIERDKKGSIDKNTKVGIYGHMDDIEGVVDANKTAKLGGRLSVKPGNAKLISNISGISEEYDIEIIKANYQSRCDDKSFVFRVKDSRLLELTGGIVQGMSGSPIMQNGKIVGAVTHVFLSDATKGYGVYTDWMLQQLEE